jgi:hypothetical protein
LGCLFGPANNISWIEPAKERQALKGIVLLCLSYNIYIYMYVCILCEVNWIDLGKHDWLFLLLLLHWKLTTAFSDVGPHNFHSFIHSFFLSSALQDCGKRRDLDS